MPELEYTPDPKDAEDSPSREFDCDCQGQGAGSGDFVLKAGDTMTGQLTITDEETFEVDPSEAGGFSYESAAAFLRYGDGDFSVGNTTGEKFIVRATGDIGFFGAAAQTQKVSGANLTNNVTAGGTDDTIADFTSLTVYATDAATIRDDIYQLARKLKQVNDALRAYGLLS